MANLHKCSQHITTLQKGENFTKSILQALHTAPHQLRLVVAHESQQTDHKQQTHSISNYENRSLSSLPALKVPPGLEPITILRRQLELAASRKEGEVKVLEQMAHHLVVFASIGIQIVVDAVKLARIPTQSVQ